MAVNIIHVSSLTLNGSWFERLVLTLHERKISQNLVTLNTQEVIFASARPKDMQIYSPISALRIIRFVEVLFLIRKAKTKGMQNFLFAQGHEDAIVSSLAAKLLGLEFGLVHHVQPLFFPELMRRKPLKGFIHYALYKFYIRRASLTQSLSLDVTESLVRLGVDPNKIVPLPHGIDLDTFAEKISESQPYNQRPDNFPVILMVGRLSWEKNYVLAIESFRKLTSEFKNAKLLIAGVGPMDSQLRELVNKYFLEQKVQFLGHVSHVPRLMVEADALLHLSVTESYGQIYIEASLADLPIISFPVGMAQELKNLNCSEIEILDSRDPIVIARIIGSLCNKSLSNRQKRKINPEQFSIHNEKNVFQSMANYLEDFGQPQHD
jgi:glycosyltransferase involved in cell wall biosynthesis